MLHKVKETNLCIEAETLKDVLWYVRGLIDQAEVTGEPCRFKRAHEYSLIEAIHLMQREVESE